jgi:hypothetical protein
MHPTHKGGRPVKHLSQSDVIQIEALAAMCTKVQIADYFGMTEKTFRAIEQRQPEVFTAYRRGKARAIADVGSALYQKALLLTRYLHQRHVVNLIRQTMRDRHSVRHGIRSRQ